MIADASTTGHGTNVIAGVAVGLESTGIAAICIGASIIGSYHLGNAAMPGGGLFGTAVATMGMLSSAVYVLAMDVRPRGSNGRDLTLVPRPVTRACSRVSRRCRPLGRSPTTREA